MAPFASTGGLADVAGSLPLALGKLGVEVKIFMPRYRGVKFSRKRLSEKVGIHFVENEAYFNRASLYGNERGDYPDNLERFAFFCRAALESAKGLGFRPDVVHANDWQTAPAPVYLKTLFAGDPFFEKTKTLLTVHNLAYQGHFPHRLFPALGLNEGLFSTEGFEFYGKVNLLKGGLLFADALSTVSPTYAQEMQTREYGWGLEGVIQKRRDKLRGILNGINRALWNPARDRFIAERYSARSPGGKAACKAFLQKDCGFAADPATPVFAMVSRLAEQKGIDILLEAADDFLSKKVNFVLLGEGDGAYATPIQNMKRRHPGKTAAFLEFDIRRAHRIYAGADFFLMPSLFEPCGLGQLISLAYGTLPIVRRTGGLADTITDIDADKKAGSGLVFEERSSADFLSAIDRARAAFGDQTRLASLRQSAMRRDFSWEKSAGEYLKYYREMAGS